MNETKKHITGNKKKDLSGFAILIVIVVLMNFVFGFYFKRFDLTSEGRYTLAGSTKKLLKNLNDIVYLKVYLQGDFNPGFTRLRNETKEILDEFRAYSNNQIEYVFINPTENSDKEEVNKIERQLYEKGIVPEQVIDRKKQKTSESLLWPGALVTFKGRETNWQIYKRQDFTPPEEALNNSVKELEYSLSNTIRKLQTEHKPEVTFIEGQGEMDTLRQFDFMRSLGEYYNVNRLTINHKLGCLKTSNAIVITKPDSTFDEKDKFIIDQYIMRGGKVLWLLDPVFINMDTFRLRGYSLGLNNPTGLEDMLFRYGVRLNPVLVQDLQCSKIPVNVGFTKGQPNFQLFSWVYNPLVTADANHPIVKNLDLIKFEFLSTIDTVSAKGIKKTFLLKTSRYSKTQLTPARVALGIVKFKPNEEQFRNSYQPVACLLEGSFQSVYENRVLPNAITSDSAIAFRDQGVNTKMIVVADGDIAKNDFQTGKGIYPLGYDKYMNQTFANKTFLLNCVNYLLDDEGLLQLRAREVKLRLLDKKKINNQETKWQLINIALPLGILILCGIIQFYIRKKRYAS